VIVTSSVSGEGLDELRRELLRRVAPAESDAEAEPRDETAGGPAPELAEHRVYRPAADRGWRVERLGDGSFRVSGRGIERLVARYDLDNEDALAYLERRLRGIGVIDALQGQGFEAGDDVEIAGVAFELDPD
jgi:GTP-binding protein